jgi:hypothetical protein
MDITRGQAKVNAMTSGGDDMHIEPVKKVMSEGYGFDEYLHNTLHAVRVRSI